MKFLPLFLLVVLNSAVVMAQNCPKLNLGRDVTVCNNARFTLNYNPAIRGQYSWALSDRTQNLSCTTCASPEVFGLTTGTYRFIATATVSPTCRTSDTLVITVIAGQAPQYRMVNDTAICRGRTLALGSPAATGNVYAWTSQPVGFRSTAANPTGQPDEPVKYFLRVTNPSCSLPTIDSAFVRVDSLPMNLQILPRDTQICFGGQATLRSKTYEPADFKNITFKWTPQTDDTGFLTPDSLYNLVVQPNKAGQFIYTRVTKSGVCTDTARATVNVKPIAMMKVTPADTLICPGRSVQMNVTYTPGVTKIEWEPATGLQFLNQAKDRVIATPGSTTMYNLKAEFDGCPVNASANITVSPLPGLAFPTVRDLCLGDQTVLNTVDDPTSTYTWSSTDPAFNQVNVRQPNIQPTRTATYSVSAVNRNGCTATGQVTITVTDAQITASGTATICANTPTNLTVSSTAPGTFVWTPGNQTGQNITVSPVATTIYTVNYVSSNGACRRSANVTVTVEGAAPVISLPRDTILCRGDSAILLNTAAASPGATYTWTSQPAGFTFSGANPAVAPTQTTAYLIDARQGRCITQRRVTIVVPRLTASRDTTICPGRPVTLTANANIGGGTFRWQPGNQNTASINVTPTANTPYTVQYTIDNCVLSGTSTVRLQPSSRPRIATVPNRDTFNIGDPIDLNAIIDQAPTGYRFNWLGNNLPIGTTQAVKVTPEVTASDDNVVLEYEVKLEVTSPQGCVETITRKLFIVQNFAIPNVFTPNNDSVNDKFQLVVKQGRLTIERMEIFNRWGGKIFDEAGANASWDGNVNGQEAPSEVYIYRITFRRGDGALQPTRVGEVTLLR
jgi:gliding motility-associated-like protein